MCAGGGWFLFFGAGVPERTEHFFVEEGFIVITSGFAYVAFLFCFA